MVLSSSANLYIKTRMSSMYNCDSVAVVNYYRRNNPHKPTKKTAHFYVFCGLQKLNTLNLRLFHSPSNPRNHFSTVLIKTNWYTTSCKYPCVLVPVGVCHISLLSFPDSLLLSLMEQILFPCQHRPRGYGLHHYDVFPRQARRIYRNRQILRLRRCWG